MCRQDNRSEYSRRNGYCHQWHGLGRWEKHCKYNNRQLTSYRRDDIGFVFQFYNLVPNLTALENVELAGQICKNPMDPKTVLEEVGLKDRLGNFPAQLSGGEQQRVS